MLPIYPPPLDLFSPNPVFLASLKSPWEQSTQTDENLLTFPHEANLFQQDIADLSELYMKYHIDHLPKVAPLIRLTNVATPIFRENLEFFAMGRLRIIRRLLPVHVQVSRIIQRVIMNLYQKKRLSGTKVHSLIQENGDFETIILADPPDDDQYFLTRTLYEQINEYLESDDKKMDLDCLSITLQSFEEENEERALIKMIIGSNKIIIRDLSFQCYQRHFNPRNPFSVQGELSFRSQLLTIQLLFFFYEKFLLPQNKKDFPQDICPFLVQYFLRTASTGNLLLNFSSLENQQRIEEEQLLWNRFLSFFRNLENLFKALYEAQKSLRGFGDFDCINKDQADNYSINEFSYYADTCEKLVAVLRLQAVPEDLDEDEDYTPDYDFFRQEALL